MDGDEESQLCTFRCADCYVYAPLPPAPSYGHRAELWNPEKWFKIVRMRVVVSGDDMYIRLEDKDSSELFAECPVPSDGTPFTTVVEPVIDSSRYFVLRVVDRTNPKKHAFLGCGFRDRNQASDFTAALDDHRQYLRRAREAEGMRKEFEVRAQLQDGEVGEGEGDGAAAAQADYSLKPGEKIHLSLKAREPSAGAPAAAGAGTSGGGGGGGPAVVVVAGDEAGGLRLQPPPPAGPSHKVLAPGAQGDAAAAGPAAASGGGTAPDAPAAAAEGRPSAQPAAAADDDWGDFVG